MTFLLTTHRIVVVDMKCFYHIVHISLCMFACEQNDISKANHRLNEVTEHLDRAIISYHDGITIERQDDFLLA